MQVSDSKRGDIFPRDVTVRPVRGYAEQQRWDALAARHHYLSFKKFYGRALRHVALSGEAWVALIGWQAGAFKVGARDAWIGWTRDQRLSRLHLIANNTRFVILGEGRVPNMASRVLGLSLRRLSDDMLALHGYPALVAESFVDPSRFSGTCYRASNWHALGPTRGYSRRSGGPVRFTHTGQPKEVFVRELCKGAAAKLRGADAPPEWQIERAAEPPPADDLRSLCSFLETVEDFRKPRGRRFELRCYLTIALAARLAGYRGVTAFAEFGELLSEEQKAAAGAFWSPSRQCYTTPAEASFRYIFSNLPPDALDRALRDRAAHCARDGCRPVALDGKDMRCASKQIETERRMMVAAVEHGSGLVLGQTQIPEKTNEIPAVRNLAKEIGLQGRTVTLDAMHAQQETARSLVEDCRADYLVTAIKGNQETILEDLKDIDWTSEPHDSCETLDKEHGRIERRRCDAVDLAAPEWDGYCDLYGRKQAIRIRRTIECVKTGKISEDTAYCLTSLDRNRADSSMLLRIVREHWHIENRLHYVRDWTYDEDRCRAHVRHTPRNLACLSNAAISIVRFEGRFQYMPPANRYYAARAQDAIDAILKPLKRS